MLHRLLEQYPLALLALADGSIFEGYSIGASGHVTGEIVFNTSMTGYQEILTDPSYCGQIITLTYPHIGNTGINEEDHESSKIHASGLVIKDLPLLASNFRSQQSLSSFLVQHQTVAIAGIDTRRLTRHLRETGAQNACILTLSSVEGDVEQAKQQAISYAKQAPSMAGADWAQKVSTPIDYLWQTQEWRLGKGYGSLQTPLYHVVAVDLGVKRNILRMLAERGCKVTVVPAQTSYDYILDLNPDGIFLSNGPGDPEPCDYAIEVARRAMQDKKPLFGICLGHQIMALASGASTFKMKFGHHGANHPVKDQRSGRVCITSQNHGFAVKNDNLPDHLEVTHISLFDGSIQGLQRVDIPAFSFQGHPEASPGPQDIGYLFDQFVSLMQKAQQQG